MYPVVIISITLDPGSREANAAALQTFAMLVQHDVISLCACTWKET